MSDDATNTTEAPTRRDYMKYGGAVIGGGLLAGCASQSESGSTPTGTETETDTPANASTDETASTPASWTVKMEPRTEVTFESVPAEVVVYRAVYADMLIALGHGDALVGIQDTQNLPMDMLAQLPEVSVDTDRITPLFRDGKFDKEILYEIDADLHLIDPNQAKVNMDLNEADISELEANVAPWLGSQIRRASSAYGPGYPYYTLYEAFEKVADAFREQQRYQALATVHDELISGITEQLPPVEDRPSVGLAFIIPGEEYVGSGRFFLADPTGPGMEMKQYRDLGVDNIWGESNIDVSKEADYETLIDIDPDVLISHNAFGFTESIEQFQTGVVDVMRQDDIGSELTAVHNDRVYRGGKNVQGPIINLFQTEVAAKQIYPETFGEWKGLGNIPEGERLFDRQRVADIVNGDF
jgi:iron complex transport system substrate-binding protein